jgi:hypothetical protein
MHKALFDQALLLCVLLADEVEYQEQKAYLFSLFNHTEAYQEQAAWCWMLKFRHKLTA